MTASGRSPSPSKRSLSFWTGSRVGELTSCTSMQRGLDYDILMQLKDESIPFPSAIM